MAFEDFRVGSVIDDKLRLERLIASGGGGAVFEACHVGLQSRVAVKVLRSGPGGPGARQLQRFLREARIAARLKSAHAVRILDIVTPRVGTPYLVMEYLQGETLADLLQRVGTLPIPDAVDYVLQAVEPLAEMHAAGIVHRDVKPSNLFLSRGRDGKPQLKLLDFGVATPDPASEAEVEITITDAEIGTPLYMAPEQFKTAKYVDARVDVWALGVTLYQLMTGRTPFAAYTIAGLSMRIMNEDPEPIERARPEVPEALAEIVMRCLVKDPSKRVPDVATLGRLLAPFAATPVAAPSPSAVIALGTRGRRISLPAVREPTPSEVDSEAPTLGPIHALIEATLAEEPEGLDASFEQGTPPPFSVPNRFFPRKGGLFRLAALPTAACVLVWMIAVIGRSAAEPESARAPAAPAAEVEAKEAPQPQAAPVARTESLVDESRVRVTSVAPAARRPLPAAAIAPSPPKAARPLAAARVAPPHASSRPTSSPRAAVLELDPIDDRIE